MRTHAKHQRVIPAKARTQYPLPATDEGCGSDLGALLRPVRKCLWLLGPRMRGDDKGWLP